MKILISSFFFIKSNTWKKKKLRMKKQQNAEEQDTTKMHADAGVAARTLLAAAGSYAGALAKLKILAGDCEMDKADQDTGNKEAEKLIKKYEEQQMNVRNNREYDAITKEIELQQLDIEILEKKTNVSLSFFFIIFDNLGSITPCFITFIFLNIFNFLIKFFFSSSEFTIIKFEKLKIYLW